MKITDKIQGVIKGFKEGQVFKYAELRVQPEEYGAAAKALERLVKTGLIKRASAGMFYKPKITAFGELRPSENELLKPYLFEKGKRVAYVTGISLYNKMGLTTQVPKNIRIASRGKRTVATVGSIRMQPVKSYVEVTNGNYYFLEILDAIKDFKTIPDLNRSNVLTALCQRIKRTNESDIKYLSELALKYPPRVRALLGAILETMKINKDILTKLRETLNPLSKYDFGITSAILLNAEKWNIY